MYANHIQTIWEISYEHMPNYHPTGHNYSKSSAFHFFFHVYGLTRVDSSSALTTRKRPIFRISSPQRPRFHKTFCLKKNLQLSYLARHTDIPKYVPLSVFNHTMTNNSLNLALEQRSDFWDPMCKVNHLKIWHDTCRLLKQTRMRIVNSLLLLHTISHMLLVCFVRLPM